MADPRVLRERVAQTDGAGEKDPRAIVSLSEARRLLFDQQARITDLELELRQRGYSDVVRDIEERAILRDLDLRAGYLRYLETAVGALNNHIVAVTNDRDAVVAHLHAVTNDRDAVVAHLRRIEAVQNQGSYRAYLKMMRALERTGPLYAVLRFGVRSAVRLRRRLVRLIRRSGR